MSKIYDISKYTNLSVATVSKVINNKGASKRATALVEEACQKLNFTPSSSARSLATKKTNLLGVAYSKHMGYGLAHPHFSQILESFKSYAEEAGYDIIFINSEHPNMGIYQHCKYRQVEGVLIAIPHIAKDMVSELVNGDVPCVSIEDLYENVPSVLSDNIAGTHQIMSHLYGLGHRKIACIAAPQDSISGWERYGAYQKFMLENGLSIDDKYVVVAEEFSQDAGYDAMEKLMEKCWADKPTAIFASYDEIAYGGLQALKAFGYQVPQDLSLIGFDNLAISELSTPKITTVVQDRKAIGRLAAQTLIDSINGIKSDEIDIRIPTKILVRETTSALR